MKILIANEGKAFCLHIPTTLLCNRIGAALLATGLRHAQLLPGGSEEASEPSSLLTADQAYGLLKAFRQSKQVLKQAGLPLVDMEDKNGSRILITWSHVNK